MIILNEGKKNDKEREDKQPETKPIKERPDPEKMWKPISEDTDIEIVDE